MQIMILAEHILNRVHRGNSWFITCRRWAWGRSRAAWTFPDDQASDPRCFPRQQTHPEQSEGISQWAYCTAQREQQAPQEPPSEPGQKRKQVCWWKFISLSTVLNFIYLDKGRFHGVFALVHQVISHVVCETFCLVRILIHFALHGCAIVIPEARWKLTKKKKKKNDWVDIWSRMSKIGTLDIDLV